MKVSSDLSRLFTLACFLWAAQAQANLIANGSFENTGGTFVPDGNGVHDLASGSTVIPSWTTTNGVPTAWLEDTNPYGIPASDGDFFLDLTSYSNSGTYGGVTQSFATTIGANYRVLFDLGYGGNSSAFGGPVSVSVNVGGPSTTYTSGSGTPNPAVWETQLFNFTATSTLTPLTITGLSTAGGFYIGLDNVDVELSTVAAVPEPSTFYLLGGLLPVLGILRRRLARFPVR